ncbi:glycerophosphodiester phosphodiesterase family protein [Stella sp.]|uniref:glycerophosphodiester phosphodiesterase family protein n=1 Tax=Stella sp. TaxID=2912054 RepID=UPI0035B46C81
MVRIVAHRGARNLWAENSLSGFRRTAALAADAVEFDVHGTRDGGVVVIHDATLDRTTHATGLVADRTVAELAEVRLRDGHGDTVPTLEQVLEVFRPTGYEIQLEIKTDALGRPYAGLEQKCIDIARRLGLIERTLFTSFAPEVLERIRAIDPKAGLLASVDRRSAEMMRGAGPMLDRFLALEGCHIAVERNLMMTDPDWFVRRIGSDRVGVWMANTVDEIRHWMGQPIRQITTDRPDLAILERDAIKQSGG